MNTLIGLLILIFSCLSFASPYPVILKPTPFSGSRFFVPNDSAKHTTVVMLHGSEGGSEPYIDAEASVLATQGFSVLVYCYFDCNRGLVGPRQTLENVEVTLILDAVAWLRSQDSSDGKVFVYGFSRGAELTMIIGSLTMTDGHRPNGLIAHSPSDVFNGPWNWSWRDGACWLCKAGLGKCSENSPKTDYQWNPACRSVDPNKVDFSVSAWLISGAHVSSGQRIEIEKYKGPILITVGEKDDVWPVDQTKRIESTLKTNGNTPEVHYFPDQGHVFRGEAEINRRQLVIDFLSRSR